MALNPEASSLYSSDSGLGPPDSESLTQSPLLPNPLSENLEPSQILSQIQTMKIGT